MNIKMICLIICIDGSVQFEMPSLVIERAEWSTNRNRIHSVSCVDANDFPSLTLSISLIATRTYIIEWCENIRYYRQFMCISLNIHWTCRKITPRFYWRKMLIIRWATKPMRPRCINFSYNSVYLCNANSNPFVYHLIEYYRIWFSYPINTHTAEYYTDWTGYFGNIVWRFAILLGSFSLKRIPNGETSRWNAPQHFTTVDDKILHAIYLQLLISPKIGEILN